MRKLVAFILSLSILLTSFSTTPILAKSNLSSTENLSELYITESYTESNEIKPNMAGPIIDFIIKIIYTYGPEITEFLGSYVDSKRAFYLPIQEKTRIILKYYTDFIKFLIDNDIPIGPHINFPMKTPDVEVSF